MPVCKNVNLFPLHWPNLLCTQSRILLRCKSWYQEHTGGQDKPGFSPWEAVALTDSNPLKKKARQTMVTDLAKLPVDNWRKRCLPLEPPTEAQWARRLACSVDWGKGMWGWPPGPVHKKEELLSVPPTRGEEPANPPQMETSSEPDKTEELKTGLDQKKKKTHYAERSVSEKGYSSQAPWNPQSAHACLQEVPRAFAASCRWAKEVPALPVGTVETQSS